MSQKFPPSEKLKSRKTIEKLFLEGKSFTAYPIKVFYLPADSLPSSQAAFAVPKRNFKGAVERNRIKRQMREGYRLNKHHLNNKNGKFLMLFLFLGKTQVSYEILDRAMVKILKKISV